MSRLRLKDSLLAAVSAAAAFSLSCSSSLCPPTGPVVVIPVVLQSWYAFRGGTAGALTEDALGNPIRVYVDTIYFNKADSTYVQATRYGGFSSGAEVITNVRSAARRYTYTPASVSLANVTLPVLLGGSATGEVRDTSYLRLTVRPTGSQNVYHWEYYKP